MPQEAYRRCPLLTLVARNEKKKKLAKPDLDMKNVGAFQDPKLGKICKGKKV